MGLATKPLGWDVRDAETQMGLESDRPTESKLVEGETYLSLRTAIQPWNLSPSHAINRNSVARAFAASPRGGEERREEERRGMMRRGEGKRRRKLRR